MPDTGNEFEETSEEVDVLSLLANESEEETEQEVDDEMPETVEGLREALKREREIKTKRNQSLKRSKQTTHRIQGEYDALLDRLDRIEAGAAAQQPNQEAENREQVAQEWRDRVTDNPEDAIGYTDYKQAQFEDKIAGYLSDKFTALEGMISGLKSETDPERVKYQKEIDSLRQKEGFSELDDDVLLKVIKGLSGARVKTPRGAVGGGKPFHDSSGKFAVTNELRKKMGFPPREEG